MASSATTHVQKKKVVILFLQEHHACCTATPKTNGDSTLHERKIRIQGPCDKYEGRRLKRKPGDKKKSTLLRNSFPPV